MLRSKEDMQKVLSLQSIRNFLQKTALFSGVKEMRNMVELIQNPTNLLAELRSIPKDQEDFVEEMKNTMENIRNMDPQSLEEMMGIMIDQLPNINDPEFEDLRTFVDGPEGKLRAYLLYTIHTTGLLGI